MTANAVYGLVLAGGESRRMGRDKALLNRNGQSQLAYVVELLGDCVDKAFVSTRAAQQHDTVRRQFEIIVDRYEGLGPIAGILSAIDTYADVDWLVVACDLPNVDANSIRNLLTYRDGSQYFTAYTSSYDGLPEPLCALYHCGCGNILRQFIADGIVCPRKMLIRSETMLLQQEKPGLLDNINTPDDLHGSVLQAT